MKHVENSKKTAKKIIGRPFPKGVSGNAGGRPKLEAGVRELAQSYTQEAMEKLIELTQSSDERVALGAIKYLLDRAWGTPQHTLEVAKPTERATDETDEAILRSYAKDYM
ncbi:MAG: hypothetical protein ACK5R5_02090 [Alphaproteobacteria bacterium]|jgi:hypothetical protein